MQLIKDEEDRLNDFGGGRMVQAPCGYRIQDAYISLLYGEPQVMSPEKPRGRERARLTYAGIPTEIMDLVDQVIETGKYGYLSRNQFINEAVKMRLRELGFYK